MDRQQLERTYKASLRRGDIEAIHDVIAKNGPGILERGVPYLLTASRNRSIDRARRDQRELPSNDVAREIPVFESWGGLVDSALVRLLASLDDREILPLWWHSAGYSDTEIASLRVEAGLDKTMLADATVRKQRQRSRERIRILLEESGFIGQ